MSCILKRWENSLHLSKTIYTELNFRSRILKFWSRLQMPRSFSRLVGYIIINHHFHQNVPHHFPQQDFLHFWQCFCTEKRVQNRNTQEKDMRAHATTYKSRKNALKIVFLQKKALKIVYLSIRVWGIDFRLVKWSGFRIIRISGLQHWIYTYQCLVTYLLSNTILWPWPKTNTTFEFSVIWIWNFYFFFVSKASSMKTKPITELQKQNKSET